MTKRDWDHVGGMDTAKYGTAWGGEDWDLLDRLVGCARDEVAAT